MKPSVTQKITHCCFDLDGTLVDSSKTIYNSTGYALSKLGIDFNVSEELFALKIGQHFVDIFNAFNIDVPDFDKFITIYKINYFEQMEHSTVYDGVEETLAGLKNKNIKISLLTTKVQDQADRIIDHFYLRKYFDLVMGRRDGIEHKPSPEPLLKICKWILMLMLKTPLWLAIQSWIYNVVRMRDHIHVEFHTDTGQKHCWK